jgi:hypothetical protein
MDMLTLTLIVAAILAVACTGYFILHKMGKVTKGVKVAFKCILAAIICVAYLAKFFETWTSLGKMTFLAGMIYVEIFLLVFSGLIFIIGLILDGENLLAA